MHSKSKFASKFMSCLFAKRSSFFVHRYRRIVTRMYAIYVDLVLYGGCYGKVRPIPSSPKDWDVDIGLNKMLGHSFHAVISEGGLVILADPESAFFSCRCFS